MNAFLNGTLIYNPIFLLVMGLLLLVLGIAFFGAPYVPTRKKDVESIFELLNLPRGAVITDLGAGDGRIVLEAAKRGYKGYAYELNPLLALIIYVRAARYRKKIIIRVGNYWHKPLPSETSAVFVFLASAYMSKLKKYLEVHVRQTNKPLLLASYGFDLPGYTPITKQGAVLIYRIEPLQA